MNALELLAAAQRSRVCTVSGTPLGVSCSICSTMLTVDGVPGPTIEDLARLISEHVAEEHAS